MHIQITENLRNKKKKMANKSWQLQSNHLSTKSYEIKH